MKKVFSFIAVVLCTVLVVSCGNGKSSKKAKVASESAVDNAEFIEAEVQLADNVLASIDSLAMFIYNEQETPDGILGVILSNLTEEQKLVKPDYLLDPKFTTDLLSHRQKVNALAILVTERPVRKAYGMPLEEVDKAIARLVADLNHPITIYDEESLSPAEKIRRTYESCKENHMECYFWQFNAAIQNNILYLIAFNSDTFFNNVTADQYKAFSNRILSTRRAAHILADYDPEIASALAFQESSWGFASVEEAEAALSDIEVGRQTIERRKGDYVKFRDWVLL